MTILLIYLRLGSQCIAGGMAFMLIIITPVTQIKYRPFTIILVTIRLPWTLKQNKYNCMYFNIYKVNQYYFVYKLLLINFGLFIRLKIF